MYFDVYLFRLEEEKNLFLVQYLFNRFANIYILFSLKFVFEAEEKLTAQWDEKIRTNQSWLMKR